MLNCVSYDSTGTRYELTGNTRLTKKQYHLPVSLDIRTKNNTKVYTSEWTEKNGGVYVSPSLTESSATNGYNNSFPTSVTKMKAVTDQPNRSRLDTLGTRG